MILAAFIALLLPVFAAVPETSESFFVNDMADVIEADTETYMIEAAENLYTETGAQVVVATVNFTDGIEIENYAMQMFNEWGIGSSDRNNGLLILLVIGEENYWVTPGTGFEELFSGGKLKLILDEYMEPDFAAENYDASARKTFDAIMQELELYYSRDDSPKSENIPIYDEAEQIGAVRFTISGIFKAIVTIVLIFLFIYLIVKIFKDDDNDHNGHGGGGRRIHIDNGAGRSFRRGFIMGGLGSEIGRSIGRDIGRGFRGGSNRSHGGFGGSRSGGGHHGGFGGGSSGRSFGGGGSAGGGFRGGGGSSRGGGAGRR